MTRPFPTRGSADLYARAALADEDAQRNILPLGALDILELAEPHRHRGCGVAIIERVGGVGARLGRGVAEQLRTVEGFGNGQHRRALDRAGGADRTSTRLNSSHSFASRMPSS